MSQSINLIKVEEFAWQVIVVQSRRVLTDGVYKRQKELPLQITISYGDEKVSTPLVQASQPLWNFWTQLPDKGGSDVMVFSLIGRDSSSGSISVEGEATLDLSRFRRSGRSFELWETLHTTKVPGAGPKPVTPSGAPNPAAELHLTIMYCSNNLYNIRKGTAGGNDADCQLCSVFGVVSSCSIS